MQTYFADVSVETLGGVADCPFLCQYYSRNTDCLQPMAPHSQTTILDKRLSIHCNSSCLYNRCGSTDVYVLYSRVHFYYLQIKDCVEEDHGFFFCFFFLEPSGVKLLWSWWLQALFNSECKSDDLFSIGVHTHRKLKLFKVNLSPLCKNALAILQFCFLFFREPSISWNQEKSSCEKVCKISCLVFPLTTRVKI